MGLRFFFLAVLTFSLGMLGCSRGKVGQRVHVERFRAGWAGWYVTAPEAWAEHGGLGYGSLSFFPGQRAQLTIHDSRYPEFIFATRARVIPHTEIAGWECTSLAVFHRPKPNGPAQNVYLREAGKDGEYRGEGTKALRERIDAFLADSPSLQELLPLAIRECPKESVSLEREVTEEGRLQVTFLGSRHRFLFHGSRRFAEAADALVPAQGEMNRWPGEGGLKAPSPVLESPTNRLLPVIQAHRFYVPFQWRGIEVGEGEIRIEGAPGRLPELPGKSEARQVPKLFLDQKEEGRWQTLTPRSVSLADAAGTVLQSWTWEEAEEADQGGIALAVDAAFAPREGEQYFWITEYAAQPEGARIVQRERLHFTDSRATAEQAEWFYEPPPEGTE